MRLLPVALALLLAGCVDPPGAPSDPASNPTVHVADPPVALAANPWRDREADVAVNPLDPLHFAVFRNERPNPYLTGAVITDPITPGLLRQVLSVSHDGGATWTHAELPHTGTASPTSAWTRWCSLADPNVLFDRDGVIHVTTLALTCGGPGLNAIGAVLHATTEDDGATWSEPATVALGAGGLVGIFHDREWTAYDAETGRFAIVWTSINPNRAALTVSFSDDGVEWTDPEEIEVRLLISNASNYLVHAVWLGGKLHVTGSGCGVGPVDFACISHFAGDAGSWERTDLTLDACGLSGPALGYATSAADVSAGRMFVAAPVVGDGSGASGVCVFASDDGGRTWPRAVGFANGDHPWLALVGDDVALAQLERDGSRWTPVVHRLALDLSVRWTIPLGPPLELDTDGDGVREYADYDGAAVGGDRFVWALTHPNQEGRAGGDTFDDLDIWVYRASLG